MSISMINNVISKLNEIHEEAFELYTSMSNNNHLYTRFLMYSDISRSILYHNISNFYEAKNFRDYARSYNLISKFSDWFDDNIPTPFHYNKLDQYTETLLVSDEAESALAIYSQPIGLITLDICIPKLNELSEEEFKIVETDAPYYLSPDKKKMCFYCNRKFLRVFRKIKFTKEILN